VGRSNFSWPHVARFAPPVSFISGGSWPRSDSRKARRISLSQQTGPLFRTGHLLGDVSLSIANCRLSALPDNLTAKPLSCPALQLETSPVKPKKRDRFCHIPGHNRESSKVAQRLVEVLRAQRNAFPGFASRIDQFIATVETDSKRSRAYDREKVIGILRAWQFGLSVTELMDDTGYSHWDIRTILKDLMARGVVEKHTETRGGHRVFVYRCTQITNDSDSVQHNP